VSQEVDPACRHALTLHSRSASSQNSVGLSSHATTPLAFPPRSRRRPSAQPLQHARELQPTEEKWLFAIHNRRRADEWQTRALSKAGTSNVDGKRTPADADQCAVSLKVSYSLFFQDGGIMPSSSRRSHVHRVLHNEAHNWPRNMHAHFHCGQTDFIRISQASRHQCKHRRTSITFAEQLHSSSS